MAPNWLHNGSHMALWRPLGGPWAPTPPEPSWRGSGTNSSWRPWNALGAKSGSISPSGRVPGRVPEGLWEVILGTFWRLGWWEQKKAPQMTINTDFQSFCCMRFLTASVCILFASALAGAKAQLKKLLETIGFCGGICVCAICARSATILQTERKSNKITVKRHTKNTLPRKRNNT